MKNIIFKLFSPIFFFFAQIFISTSKNMFVVTTQTGKRFGDNTKKFFLFMLKQKEFDTFLLTKNKPLFKQLSNKYPGKVIYSWSIKGLITYLKAEIILISNGNWDIHPYFPLRIRKTFINLWHGTPLKRINHLLPKNSKIKTNNLNFCKYTCTSSEFTKYLMAAQFQKHIDDIWVTGQPRNDRLFEANNSIAEENKLFGKKIILYAPTYRVNEELQLFPFDDFEIKLLHQSLEKYDAYFLIRNHVAESSKKLVEFINYSDRFISANHNTYPSAEDLLYHTDILVTDYSSIYFDFLLLNRPIIYMPYDRVKYEKKVGFNFDYEKNTPGPKVSSFTEFIKSINTYLEYPNTDSGERILIRDKFNEYADNKSCERVFEKIKKILN